AGGVWPGARPVAGGSGPRASGARISGATAVGVGDAPRGLLAVGVGVNVSVGVGMGVGVNVDVGVGMRVGVNVSVGDGVAPHRGGLGVDWLARTGLPMSRSVAGRGCIGLAARVGGVKTRAASSAPPMPSTAP